MPFLSDLAAPEADPPAEAEPLAEESEWTLTLFFPFEFELDEDPRLGLLGSDADFLSKRAEAAGRNAGRQQEGAECSFCLHGCVFRIGRWMGGG